MREAQRSGRLGSPPGRAGRGRRRGRAGRALAGAGTAVALLVVLAGCAGDEPSLGEGSLRDAAGGIGGGGAGGAATSTTLAEAEGGAEGGVHSDDRVLADYLAYWEDVAAASSSTGDPSSRLDDHAVQPQFGSALGQIRRDRAAGRIARGAPRLLDSVVEDREGGRATVTDCMDSSRWQYYGLRTGKPVGEPSGKRYRVTASLRLVGSVWKVSTLRVEEEQCGG